MPELFCVVPNAQHDTLVQKAYAARGYDAAEAAAATRLCASAAQHGIRTHNAIKALHLDDLFGSKVGGWKPRASIRKLPSRFAAAEVWDANFKLGQAVAYAAMDRCLALADQFGVGIVSVDNAAHYLWGGGYVLEAAQKGYLAYTNCTSALAEVVPFGGRAATLGTNPHSWAFPTQEAIGFPIVVDWATSTIAMGRVQQFKREGAKLPPDCAVDAAGCPTRDPNQAVGLLPFGGHKGYGLGVIDELIAAFIGGSLPTLRGKPVPASTEKHGTAFFFQAIHPEAIRGGGFAQSRNQTQNLKAVLQDILGHGNEKCLLPGELEARAAERSRRHGGLLFSPAEIEAFGQIARVMGEPPWSPEQFPSVSL